MLIGLVSDTHNNRPGVRYALDIFDALGIEVILHAGDLISAQILDEFIDFSLFLTFGNGDDPLMISSKAGSVSERFACGEMLDLNLAGKRIFMIHGDHRTEQEKRIDSGDYDFVIHGHTHRYRDERVGSTRVINPGALGGGTWESGLSRRSTLQRTNCSGILCLEILLSGIFWFIQTWVFA